MIGDDWKCQFDGSTKLNKQADKDCNNVCKPVTGTRLCKAVTVTRSVLLTAMLLK